MYILHNIYYTSQFPPPWSLHALYRKMSKSRILVMLKVMTKKIPFIQISVATNNCGIPSRSRVHSPGTLSAFPLTNPRYAVLSCTILLAYPTPKHLFFFFSRHQSTSSTNYPLSDCQYTPIPRQTWPNHRRTPLSIFSATSSQLPYLCIRDFSHSFDT